MWRWIITLGLAALIGAIAGLLWWEYHRGSAG